MLHYLDDYFVVGRTASSECQCSLDTTKTVCKELNLPLADEKQEGPSTQLNFLGVLLDSDRLEACLPPDKLQEIKEILHKATIAVADWHPELRGEGSPTWPNLSASDDRPQNDCSQPIPPRYPR